jgi:hypothetical protein
MCPVCQGFAEVHELRHPAQVWRLLEQIRVVVGEGTLLVVGGSCALAELQPERPWPDDAFTLRFRCRECPQEFSLAVETYHGAGGRWAPCVGDA